MATQILDRIAALLSPTLSKCPSRGLANFITERQPTIEELLEEWARTSSIQEDYQREYREACELDKSEVHARAEKLAEDGDVPVHVSTADYYKNGRQEKFQKAWKSRSKDLFGAGTTSMEMDGSRVYPPIPQETGMRQPLLADEIDRLCRRDGEPESVLAFRDSLQADHEKVLELRRAEKVAYDAVCALSQYASKKMTDTAWAEHASKKKIADDASLALNERKRGLWNKFARLV